VKLVAELLKKLQWFFEQFHSKRLQFGLVLEIRILSDGLLERVDGTRGQVKAGLGPLPRPALARFGQSGFHGCETRHERDNE